MSVAGPSFNTVRGDGTGLQQPADEEEGTSYRSHTDEEMACRRQNEKHDPIYRNHPVEGTSPHNMIVAEPSPNSVGGDCTVLKLSLAEHIPIYRTILCRGHYHTI